ncbi:MAG: phage portal protein, partial [Carnobacterium sp.]
QKKSRKNIDISEDVYVAGSGNRIILPKQSGMKYDLNRNAPFDIYNLDYCSSFIVYSSNYTKEKLFGCIITTIDCDNPENTKYELMIYDYLHSYCFSCTTLKGLGIGDIRFIEKSEHSIGYCPFVEFKANKARMGIVEVVEPLFDAVNLITSNTLDNIVDVVGGILLVINNTITGQDKKQVDETGSLTLSTIDPSKPVDARYLINQLQYGEVNLVREELIKTAYNIVGVPQATTQSTSGGDTGQARMLGGGWSRADIVAKQDEPCLKEAESEMLEIAISICNKQPDCKINDLYANDIEVNFCRNKNDNLLVKTQSLQTLIGMNVPKETALNIVELTANPHEVAIEWQTLNDSIEEKNKETEYKKEQLGGNESGLQKETEKETKEIE